MLVYSFLMFLVLGICFRKQRYVTFGRLTHFSLNNSIAIYNKTNKLYCRVKQDEYVNEKDFLKSLFWKKLFKHL